MGFKGITWVGDIYQQFEEMCLEAEEVIYEDTVKYVESQVQTVGASVKKLYSDVMQDLLLPCYVEPLEVASKQLPLSTDIGIYKKQKTSTKEDHVGIKDDKHFVKDPETSMFSAANVNHSSPSSEGSTGGTRLTLRRKSKRNSHLSSTSVNLGLKDFSKASLSSEIGDNHEAVHEQKVMTTCLASSEVKEEDARRGEKIITNEVSLSDSPENASCDDFASDMTLASESSLNKETEVRNTYSTCEPGLRTSNDGVLPAELCADIDAQQCESSAETGSSRAGIEIRGDQDLNLIDEDSSVNAGDILGDTKLEETCVLVDGDRPHLVSGKEHASSSYKKKIQKAFIWKRSSRKQEYKQLAAQYGQIETEADNEDAESLVPTPAMAADAKRLPSHGSCESEWELL